MQADRGNESILSAINVTPLVDVALVLVMVFMITLPYLMDKGLPVRASGERAAPAGPADGPILIEVSRAGVRLEGQAVPKSELAAELIRAIARRKADGVAVSADRGVSHAEVIEVLDQAMDAGAQRLDLLEPEEARL